MHPCLSCGACCAHFRVGFHWSEADSDLGGQVPLALTEPFDHHRLVMRGTWEQKPRCVALDAEIGVRSRCSIHPQRPTVCRDVPASWEFGAASPQCDKARVAWGLPALTAADWRWRDGAANDGGNPDDHDNDPSTPLSPIRAA